MSRSEPTPQELAAIVAAVELSWLAPPRPVEADEARSPWRWSGRWWASDRPVAADRRRPN